MKKLIFGVIATIMFLNFSIANTVLNPKTNVSDFLNNYYDLGKSIETKANNKNIIVFEVLNKKNSSINGYIAFDKESNDLLYFVDYMRNSKEIKAIDFLHNQTDILNLEKDNNFENFIKIDLIKEIEKINLDPSSATKFWGTSCGGSFSLEAGTSYRVCCYYVLWVNTGCQVVGAK